MHRSSKSFIPLAIHESVLFCFASYCLRSQLIQFRLLNPSLYWRFVGGHFTHAKPEIRPAYV